MAAVSDFGNEEKTRAAQLKQRDEDEERKKERRKKIPLVIIALALIIVPIQLFLIFKGPEDLPIDRTDVEEVTD